MPKGYNTRAFASELPELEKRIEESWLVQQVFERSLEQTKSGDPYILYDGPPFATGLPHYGHMLAHAIKDVVPRYQTMRGRYVERRFGWDCHGVPIEADVENQYQQESKTFDRNSAAGIAEFNERCRTTVMRYAQEWRATESRVGRFVDMDNDYKTMNPEFMESVWAVFKQLYKRDLVYKGYRVVAYSPKLRTSLSDFEAKSNYQTIRDPSVVVSFPLLENPDVSLLVWTTTPWTLITNAAIAIKRDIQYVQIETTDHKLFIVSLAAAKRYFSPENIISQVIVNFDDLLGKHYKPLFEVMDAEEKAKSFKLVESAHVTEDNGTGLVHISPAFGEDDFEIGQKHNLPQLDFFDEEGHFKSLPNHAERPDTQTRLFTDLEDVDFKSADKLILAFLKANSRLFLNQTFEHQYPCCWRTQGPLMYRAIPAWYVNVTTIKDRMIQNNQKINWYPDFVGQKRFAEWLKNAHDWNVSRNRYWGTPIPIWVNVEDENDIIVVGSIDELKELSGEQDISDLHSHKIDHLRIRIGDKIYKRVPEVFDCWFESGSMPYAQKSYLFDNDDAFLKTSFPANFIAEGLDQTRGWFYTLLILSTALFDRPPFENCVVNGILLGNDGKKMSKSKRNFPALDKVFDTYGADALRYVLLGSPATQAQELSVTDGLFHNAAKELLIPITNIYTFFALAANKYQVTINEIFDGSRIPTNPLDAWLIHQTESFKKEMTDHLDKYNLIAACSTLKHYVQNVSRWYIRNIKIFLANDAPAEREMHLQCLHFALDTLSKCAAPIIPFITDAVFKELYGQEKSVHLEQWPSPLTPRCLLAVEHQGKAIEKVREIAGLVYTLREKKTLSLRQPLSTLYLDSSLRSDLTPYEELIRQVANVQYIEWSEADAQFDTRVKLEAKVLGPRLGQKLKEIQLAVSNGSYALDGDSLTVCNVTLNAQKGEFSVYKEAKKDTAAESSLTTWVALNTELTPELKHAAACRSLEREIMKIRKRLGLQHGDRVELFLTEALNQLLSDNERDEILAKTGSVLLREQRSEPASAFSSISRLTPFVDCTGEIYVYILSNSYRPGSPSSTGVFASSRTQNIEPPGVLLADADTEEASLSFESTH